MKQKNHYIQRIRKKINRFRCHFILNTFSLHTPKKFNRYLRKTRTENCHKFYRMKNIKMAIAFIEDFDTTDFYSYNLSIIFLYDTISSFIYHLSIVVSYTSLKLDD